jgi:hypothetical protein
MNIMIGDTIATDDREIGIVENRAGDWLTVRFPDSGNRREQVRRAEAKPLAELAYEARRDKTPLRVSNPISLVGNSTLAELVALFGYSTGLMRRESLYKVIRQLERAGLEITAQTDRWSRDDKFKIGLARGRLDGGEVEPDGTIEEPLSASHATMTVDLPDPFWPTALGLDRRRELDFLRAFTLPEPILCLLHVPMDADVEVWIQATWEGIVAWAFRTAQRFVWNSDGSSESRRTEHGDSMGGPVPCRPGASLESTRWARAGPVSQPRILTIH